MKLRTRLLVAFLFVSALPAVAVSLVAYVYARDDLRAQMVRHLEAVAGIQESRLEARFTAYLERARAVSLSPRIRSALSEGAPTEGPELTALQAALDEAVDAHELFRAAAVVGRAGELVGWAGTPPPLGEPDIADLVGRAPEGGAFDLLGAFGDTPPSVWIAVPVAAGDTALGTLLIQASMAGVNEVVDDPTGVGETGEMVLARLADDGGALFVSPTRFDPAAAFRRRVAADDSDSPVIRALSGSEGRLERSVDYRGQPVLASARNLSGGRLGLVVKIDRSEAFAPMESLGGTLAVVTLAFVAGLTLLSLRFSSTIAAPIARLADTADRIEHGQTAERAIVEGEDEIASLAAHFNSMTDRLLAANRALEERVRERTAELRRSEETFRALVEDVEDYAIFMLDPEGRVATWNVGAEKGTGYPAGEILGRHLSTLFADEEHDVERMNRHLAVARQRGRVEIEAWHERRDGSRRFMSAVITALKGDEEDGPRGFSLVARDLTARLRAESRRKRFFDLSSELLCVADPEGRFVDLNAAWTRTLGWGVDELKARPFLDFVHPEDRERTLAEAARMGAGGQTAIFQNRYETSDGDYRWLAWTSVLDPDTGEVMAVARDVTAEHALRTELERARTEAEAAARAKSQFLANMSHEIRTPMNAVIGMSALLTDTSLDAEQQDFVDTIRTAGDHLLALINDILDYSKIEAGMLRLDARPFAVRSVVEEALDLVAPEAARKGLDLAYVMDEGTPEGLVGDPGRLRQVLVNLLSNAVKFTDEGEVVATVRVEDRPAGRVEIAFRVRDTGVGIPEEALERIFRAFEQEDSSSTRRFGGTGLGLTISRHLCELMGGQLTAGSRVGGGSTFTATIVGEPAEAPTVEPWRQGVIDLKDRRVLVVDDSEMNRRILEKWLSGWGMVAELLGDPFEALDRLRSGERFDLVLLDHQMPGMDGSMLTARLEEEVAEHPPIVMLTSLDQDPLGGIPGLAGVVVKPLRPSRVFDAIAGVLYDGRAALRSDAPAFDPEMANRMPLRILLAEDNPVNQKVAGRMLSQLGYEADLATDGVEAVEKASRTRYDVILMDVQMPGMDGLEATRELRRTIPGEERPRIVAMTAHAGEEIRRECRAAGMDDYLTKPVSPERLVEALSRAAAPAPSGEPEAATPDATADPGGDGPELVDPSSLAELRQWIGDDLSFLRTLVEKFHESASPSVEEMAGLAEAGDARGVALRAHSLKASSAQLGARPLSALAAELEELGTAGAPIDVIRDRVTSMRQILPRTLHQLDELVDRLLDEAAG